MKLLLGIDYGTGGCKVTVLDETGAFVGEASTEYVTYHDHPGWSEQEPGDWWTSLKASLEKLFTPAVDLRGYFDDQILFPTNSLDHGEIAGAHRVLEVDASNFVGYDVAAYYQKGHQFLRAGSFALNIPNIWYSSDMKFTNGLNTVRQFHRLKSNGEMTVYKFGYWATRNLDNSSRPLIGPWEGE